MWKAVVPDLPYVHSDVPDDSEAPDNSGRFAGLVRGRGLWPRSASMGTNEYRLAAVRRAIHRVRRGLLVGLAVSVASAVWCTLLTPETFADDLTDQRKQIQRQITQTKHDLSESSEALRKAGIAVARTQAQLDFAEAKLAQTQRELAVARARDIAAAAKLKKARADLAAAKAAVVTGQRELDAQEAMAGRVVRDQYQQQTNLMPVALLVGASSPEDLQTRLQWSTTMFDTTQAEIVTLTEIQPKLEAAKARQAALEKQVAAAATAAAGNLALPKTPEAQVARKAKARAKAAQRKARGSSSSSSAQRASQGFMMPVPGAITSPYGRRFHPILHYWKLHDGTDFRAGCGTAIRAPYKGRVEEKYYSGGYGNRLMIDHGNVRGKYVTTGYNHANRYTVRVGQRVRKG